MELSIHQVSTKKAQAVKRRSSVLPAPPHGPFSATSQSARGRSNEQDRPRTPFTGCSLKRVFPHHELINRNESFCNCIQLTNGPSVIVYKNLTFSICQKNELCVWRDRKTGVLPVQALPNPAGPPQSEPDTQETDTSPLAIFLK